MHKQLHLESVPRIGSWGFLFSFYKAGLGQDAFDNAGHLERSLGSCSAACYRPASNLYPPRIVLALANPVNAGRLCATVQSQRRKVPTWRCERKVSSGFKEASVESSDKVALGNEAACAASRGLFTFTRSGLPGHVAEPQAQLKVPIGE